MRIKYSLALFLFYSTTCFSQQTDPHLDAIEQDRERYITLSGFPSRGIESITFYKKNVWFKWIRMQDPLAVTQPEVCHSCQEVFTDTFLDKLFALKTEKIPSNGCRIVKDTIIDGKKAVSISDFYMISDLEEQTITITKGTKTHSVSYLAPRYAIKYCKDNTDRLAFMRASDRLLKIK